jgi:hypothetical protein
VIIALDTSGDTADDRVWMQPEIDALGPALAAGSADVRVVFLSLKSDSANGFCMPPPLGSGSCPGDDASPRFWHPAVEIGSTNALKQLIDQFGSYQPALRSGVPKHIVVITTDNSAMAANDFDTQLKALDPPNFSNYVFHGIYAFSTPILPGCLTDAQSCCLIGVAAGTTYAALAQQTGGERVDICSRQFDAVWRRVASCP